MNAKAGHVLEQADRIGNGDVDVRLLQAIAKAGVEDLGSYCFKILHFFPYSLMKMSIAIDGRDLATLLSAGLAAEALAA
jgi:hypothetical protein